MEGTQGDSHLNIISYSLYGTDPKYSVGIVRNLELIPKIYPDWKAAIYHDDSLSHKFLKKIESKALLFNVSSLGDGEMPGMFWRFLAYDLPDVDRVLIRDADSRISLREKEAVDEWIKSGKTLHIMRDHPHHVFHILGGMFGLVKKEINMKKEISSFLEDKTGLSVGSRMVDQEFLKQCFYFRYKEDSMVHSGVDFDDLKTKELMANKNFSVNEKTFPFPSKRKDLRFVGEQVGADESRGGQYRLLDGLKEAL